MVFLLSLLAPGAVMAQETATIAAVEPEAEIQRDGSWSPAGLGSTLLVGDRLRTGPSGRLRVVFRNGLVVSVSGGSEVSLDEHAAAPEEDSFNSLVGLLRGKMRALVSEYYRTPTSSFRVETKTGVAGARGTDFVVVYDEASEVMDVVGISGSIAVRSLVALAGSEVVVTERELTSVARGKLPTAPVRLDETLFRQYLDGLEFAGAGRPESLALSLPLTNGEVVPEDDRAHVVLPEGVAPQGWSSVPGEPPYDKPDVSSLIGEPPAAVLDPGGLGVRF
jgi:hypothetical protein